jgi:hypothetical protein
MKIFLLFASSIFLAGCQPGNTPLAGTWIYSNEVIFREGKNYTEKFKLDEDARLSSANFLYLRPDSQYTANIDSFESGRWFIRENQLILLNTERKSRELIIQKLTANELVCTPRNKRVVYGFNAYPSHFSSEIENPFSKVNNAWRLRALHKESDRELATRLQQHFRFWEKYMEWGYKEKLNELDVRNTPSLLKIYGNGFQLEYYENLLPEWKQVFYDTTDCRIAYEMLYYKMYEKAVKWSKDESKFKTLANAFVQLQSWMDEPPSRYIKR